MVSFLLRFVSLIVFVVHQLGKRDAKVLTSRYKRTQRTRPATKCNNCSVLKSSVTTAAAVCNSYDRSNFSLWELDNEVVLCDEDVHCDTTTYQKCLKGISSRIEDQKIVKKAGTIYSLIDATSSSALNATAKSNTAKMNSNEQGKLSRNLNYTYMTKKINSKNRKISMARNTVRNLTLDIEYASF